MGLHFTPPGIPIDSPSIPRYFRKIDFFEPEGRNFSVPPGQKVGTITKSGRIPAQRYSQPPSPIPAIRGPLGLHFAPPDIPFDSPSVFRYFRKIDFSAPK